MFKIVLLLTHGHQIAHKFPTEEEALEMYFDIQQAMQSVAQDRIIEILPVGDSILVPANHIVSCELRGPRSQ